MKPEFRLQNIIKEGLNDTFLIWKSELKNKFIQTINARFGEWIPVKWKWNEKCRMVFF